MESVNDLIVRLKDILANKTSREFLVKDFIKVVINLDFSTESEDLKEDFISLANELDLYEPNNEYRKESNSFFGDEKLEKIINEKLSKL